MEEKTADFFERIKGMIPREAQISDIRYEGSDVAVYIKNKKTFAENGAFVKEIVSALKKRILLRPDPSICINPEKAEEIIKLLIPADAGLKEIYFEPEFGTVVLETDKPGVAIGKGGEILREIKKQTYWNVDIKRVPAIPSDVVKTLHELLYKESVFRKDFLDRTGKRIHSGWKGTEWIRFTTLGGYREVGRSCTLLQTPESKILMDCGLKPGTNEYPYLSVPEFNMQSLDAVVLSHSHLDHCLHPDTLIEFPDGSIDKIENFYSSEKKDVKALDIDNSLKIEDVKCAEKTKIKAPKKLYHIKTKTKEIKSTGEHPFFVLDGLDIISKKADELKEGEFITVARRMPFEGKTQKLPKIVRNLTFSAEGRKILIEKRKEKNIRQADMAEKIGCSQAHISDIESGGAASADLINQLLDVYSIDKNKFVEVYATEKHSKSEKIILPENSSPEFCQFIGYILGDSGKADSRIKGKRLARLSLTDKDVDNLKFYSKLAKEAFSLEGTIKIKDRNRLEFYSPILLDFISAISPEVVCRSPERKVPSIISKVTKKELAAFIRGFYDAEGSATAHRVALTNTSKEIMDVMKLFLLRFGIVSHLYESKNSRSKRKIFQLCIYNPESIRQFQKQIGFSSIKKIKALEKLAEKIGNACAERMDLLPITDKSILMIAEKLGISRTDLRKMQINFYHYGKHKLSRKKAAHILEKFNEVAKKKNINMEELKKIEALIQSDVNWEPVQKIELVNSDCEFVYDLKVPGHHNYIANGIIVHNCGFIPYLYEYGFDGPLYCTAPTRDLMVLLCLDFIEIAQREGKPPLYTSKGVKEAVKHAVTLEYGEVSDITPDMRLTLLNAGHLLGSSITHVHVGNGMHNIAYTGDLKFDRTALFEPASADFARVETLITESTYGAEGDFQPPRAVAEANLVKCVKKVMDRRGKVIIPAFAVERAQDVMAILAENGLEQPVYLDGMLWDASAIYTAYPEYLSREMQQMIFREGFNPFTSEIFKRVGSQTERKAVIESADPCVIIATSGMLSVDAEEPVLIRNSGKPKLVKIGEFIDKKIEKSEKKIRFDGCIEGEAVKIEGVDVAALDFKTGKVGFMPATFVMRHKVDKPLYEIVAKSGRSVKVTASHSVLVLENGKITEKKVENMKEGDVLIVPKTVENNSERLGEIDLLREILDNVPEDLQKSIFVRGEDVLNFAENDWQRKNKTVHISSLKDKTYEEECDIGFGCSTNREIKRTLETTPELGKMLGYFAAEGHITISEESRTGRIAFSFGPTEIEMAKETAAYLQSCFGMESDIIEDKEKSCITVKVDSKLLAFVFKYVLKTGSNAHEKRIPGIIFKADKSVQLKFMEGYLKGDGYVGKRGKRVILEFSSVSKNMISDLAYLLTLNNVSVPSLREKIRKPTKIRNREVAESKRWVLTITNSSYIRNFQEILPKEIQTMLSEIRDYEEQAPFSLPIRESGLKQILKSVKSKELKNQKWGIYSRKRVSFERARKIMDLLKNENKNLDTSQIEILLSGCLGFDSVKKISKAESSSEYVYDFSVDGHENFLGGFGGILLHNTGGPAMEYVKQLAGGEKNMLMFVGYQAEGTLGRKIQKGWKEIPVTENGRTASLPIKFEIATVEGLSGHSDRKQLINYIYRLRQKPERIVCCHGEASKCMELAHDLHSIFRCETMAPKLLETVRVR